MPSAFTIRFGFSVARIAKANQVAQFIGFFRIGKAGKATNMMDIQFFAQFIFGLAALLAFVIVALAGLAALLSPVFSVVRRITAAPSGVLFTTRAVQFEPLCHT